MKRSGFKKLTFQQSLEKAVARKIKRETGVKVYPAPKTSERPRITWKPAPKPSIKAGRKVAEWAKARAWLKVEFERLGITNCEFGFIEHKCENFALSFAHCRKRRLLLEGELYHVAVACQTVHTIIDYKMTHEQMHEAVHRAIENHGGVIWP